MKSSSTLRRGHSIRNRILLWLLVIALIPCALLGGLGYWTIVTELESSAQREMRRAAVSTSRCLSEIMNARCSDVLVWSGLPLIKKALEVTEVREDASERLRDMVRLYGGYEAILLLDRDGVSVASSRPELVGMDFTNHQAFKDAKSTGKLYVGDAQAEPTVVTIDPTSNGWTLAVAAPVEATGNVMGVLLAWLKWKPIEALVQTIFAGESGYVYVLDKTNRIIVHPRRDLYGTDAAKLAVDYPQLPEAIAVPQKDFIHDLASKEIGKPDSKIESLAYPGALGNFPSLCWTVAAGMDRNELLSFLPNIVRHELLIGVGIIVGVIVMAILIAGSIAHPITRLAAVISQVGDTLDLTVRAPVKVKDEIGEASETFNALLSRLQGTVSAVVSAVGRVRQASAAVKEVTLSSTVNATAQAERVQIVLNGVTAIGETVQTVQADVLEAERASTMASESLQRLACEIEGMTKSAVVQDTRSRESESILDAMGQTIAEALRKASEQLAAARAASEKVNHTVRTIDDVAESAATAARQSESAERFVSEGEEAVDKVAQGIRSISESSEQINEIVAVVSSISEHASLLALNAAIQAAGAREHGKGFAVVADGVQKLAKRAEESTNEIGELIKESHERVEEGERLSASSRNALLQIREALARANQLIRGIAQGTMSQTEKITKVQQAVERLTILAQNILDLTSEQTESRQRAADLMSESRYLSSSILDKARAGIETSRSVCRELAGVTERAQKVTKLTSLQSERAVALTELISEMASVASLSVDGAASASQTTHELGAAADELGRLMKQFRVSCDV